MCRRGGIFLSSAPGVLKSAKFGIVRCGRVYLVLKTGVTFSFKWLLLFDKPFNTIKKRGVTFFSLRPGGWVAEGLHREVLLLLQASPGFEVCKKSRFLNSGTIFKSWSLENMWASFCEQSTGVETAVGLRGRRACPDTWRHPLELFSKCCGQLWIQPTLCFSFNLWWMWLPLFDKLFNTVKKEASDVFSLLSLQQ